MRVVGTVMIVLLGMVPGCRRTKFLIKAPTPLNATATACDRPGIPDGDPLVILQPEEVVTVLKEFYTKESWCYFVETSQGVRGYFARLEDTGTPLP
jgi:hypothetical protein